MMDQLMTSKNKKGAEPFPENEVIRAEALNVRPDPKLIVESLQQMTSLQVIHTSWLFKEIVESKLLLSSLCKSLSSYSANSNSSWYNFSGYLGIDWQSIEVIRNDSSDKDKTELCLQTYAQQKNSTLEKIINVLASFERYDALSKAKTPIEKLVSFIYSDEGVTHWDPLSLANYKGSDGNLNDSGYFSLSDGDNVDKIIRPRNWERLYLMLPISLQDNENICTVMTKNQSSNRTHTIDNNYQQAVPVAPDVTLPVRRPLKTVFLTLAGDGRDAAMRIAAKLRAQQYGVLILDENHKLLLRNPEYEIFRLFNLVDYVMPILTKGYIKAIKKSNVNLEMTSALSSMDERYARYIFTMMCTEYCDNSCYNNKFHCVIPNEVDYRSIAHKLRGQLVFRIWTNECDLDKFMKKLL